MFRSILLNLSLKCVETKMILFCYIKDLLQNQPAGVCEYQISANFIVNILIQNPTDAHSFCKDISNFRRNQPNLAGSKAIQAVMISKIFSINVSVISPKLEEIKI